MMEIRHLRLAYGSRILAQDISFHLEGGECVLLAGANGCGKSSLLRVLAEPGGTPSAKCILIPTNIPKVKGFTAEEFVRTGCFRESNWAGKLRPETERRLQEALKLLGLNALAGRDISTLSDGEFQKACIAVGLARRAGVLLLDEPTAYLDVENRQMVLHTLRQVARETGTAVLFSSHDLADSLAVAHRVLAFTPDGRFLESTPDTREAVLHAAFPSWR